MTSSHNIMTTLSAKELLESETLATPWTHGSGCFRSVSEWIERRYFISAAFNHDGSVLDIGCANAFFLACLSTWVAPLKVTPYGVEVDSSISDAKLLFPQFSNNFVQLKFEDFLRQISDRSSTTNEGFSLTYDFIYWSTWTDYHFDNPENIDSLKKCFQLSNLMDD